MGRLDRMLSMSIPSYDAFVAPLLALLAKHADGLPIARVHEELASHFKLTEDERADRLPSGAQSIYKNRIGWAHDRLKRCGLSASPRRGQWKLTDDGLRYAVANPTLPPSELERILRTNLTASLRPRDAETSLPPSAEPGGGERTQRTSPDERIDAAIQELREGVARDLLENIGQSSSEFFERLVLDLLHAMGYGTSRADLQRVGGSGDGGIDGIISLDRLGLEKVYIQAKRWKQGINVGSPDIQGFMGALQLQGASKGVFLTTSSFTREARAAADRARGSIVLVDGARLADLMMDHGVGVTHKSIRIPKIDLDVFESE
jgi:restriction system protein